MRRELIDLVSSIDIDESHICDGKILQVGLPCNLVMHNVTSDVVHAISDFFYGRRCYKGIRLSAIIAHSCALGRWTLITLDPHQRRASV